MLQNIYDPRNRYPVMESNPLHSKDIMHGVPTLFNDLFTEAIENYSRDEKDENQSAPGNGQGQATSDENAQQNQGIHTSFRNELENLFADTPVKDKQDDDDDQDSFLIARSLNNSMSMRRVTSNRSSTAKLGFGTPASRGPIKIFTGTSPLTKSLEISKIDVSAI